MVVNVAGLSYVITDMSIRYTLKSSSSLNIMATGRDSRFECVSVLSIANQFKKRLFAQLQPVVDCCQEHERTGGVL